MGQSSFKIEVSDGVVDASWDSSIGERLAIGLVSCGMALPLLYASMFQHGKKPGLVLFVLDNPELFKGHVDLLCMELIFIVVILSILVNLSLSTASATFSPPAIACIVTSQRLRSRRLPSGVLAIAGSRNPFCPQRSLTPDMVWFEHEAVRFTESAPTFAANRGRCFPAFLHSMPKPFCKG